jgi:hypothetical protein
MRSVKKIECFEEGVEVQGALPLYLILSQNMCHLVTNALSRVMSRVLVSARRVRLNEFTYIHPQDMLEAKLNEAATLKRLLDGMKPLFIAGPTCDDADWHVAVKELVQDANFECNESGIVSKPCLSFFRGP